jgi:hypothetical protein
MSRLTFKKVTILSFLLTIAPILTQSQSINKVRILLEKTEKEKEKSLEYAEFFKNSSSPVITGYAAMFYFLYADYLINPFSKLKYFNIGKSLIDSCITANPKIIELRLLRYVVQKEIPSILAYNNLEEDKKILLEAVKSNAIHDEYLYKKILEVINYE